MTTSFSRIQEMTGQQRPVLADEFSEASRIAVAEPAAVVGGVGPHPRHPALGTAKEWVEAALGDLENRETEPDVEQEGLMIGIPSDLMDAVAETRAGMKQLNVNLEHVVELLEQLIEIQRDEMRRIS
jgi:hypothetical protein